MVVLIGFVWAVYSFINSASDVVDAKPQSATTNQAAKIPDWHRAESKEEVARRIKERLVGELDALGLDASNIVANAKAHPTRLVACVPEHKRTRLLVLSTNDESVIARSYVEECEKNGRFDDKTDQIARVRAIAERLVPAIPEIDTVPGIHILRDDSVNACCLPDGTMFVNTGTLKTITDDSILAAILSHELGHAAARHGNEAVSLALVGAAGESAFEELLAGMMPALNSREGVSLVRFVYGIGINVGFKLPRSRRNEFEADRLGVRYLARAGFDPESMVHLFDYLEATHPLEKDVFVQLLSKHPLTADRIEHARKALSEPDLSEMPKVRWSGELKRKADEIDFSNVDYKAAASNAASRLPKLPWRRKPTEKGQDLNKEQ